MEVAAFRCSIHFHVLQSCLLPKVLRTYAAMPRSQSMVARRHVLGLWHPCLLELLVDLRAMNPGGRHTETILPNLCLLSTRL